MTLLSLHGPDSPLGLRDASGALPLGRSLVLFFCLRFRKRPSSVRQNRTSCSQADCKHAVLDDRGFRDVLGGRP